MSIVSELGAFEEPKVQVSGLPYISMVGIRKIDDLLKDRGRPTLPDGFPKLVESRMGKMPARVQRYMQAYHATTLSSKEVETIGNVADKNICHGKTVIYDFTYNILTWPRGSFGNNGSCWRTTHASSIPMFRHGVGHGPGFALRVFRPHVEGQWYNNSLQGYGRCWCMPLGDDALLAFNPYGDKLSVFSALLANSLPTGKYMMRGTQAVSDHKGIYVNGDQATLLYVPGSKWDNTKKRITLKMLPHYTRECHQCQCRFGSTDEDARFCNDCAVTCFVTGETIGNKSAAHVTDVNFLWSGVSYHVPSGFISTRIAAKILEFCYVCLRFHGNLDECNGR